MTATGIQTSTNRALVQAFYAAAVAGNLAAFVPLLDPAFVCSAPSYLPWGGTRPGRDVYLGEIIPEVGRALDFSRFAFESLTAQDSHVVALIRVGVRRTDTTILISEHFEIRNGKAMSIWVAYFEPKVLLDQLGIASL